MIKKKVAIIGLGHQSQSDHIPGILKSKDAELVAVCDIDKGILNKISNKLSVKGYKDYNDLFSKEKLDFVIIAVPHYEYTSIVRKAIESKVHILKEKPFALTMHGALELHNLCFDNNIHMMITMQRRFNPIFYSFFQLVDQIGSIYSIDIKYNLYVKNPHIGWRADNSKSGGGCIIDMGYHMVDMIIWYFGLPDDIYTEMSAHAISDEKYDAEDTASILFSYGNNIKNKISGVLEISRHKPPKTELIKVYGSKGILSIQRGSIKRFDINGDLIESLIREFSWPTASTNQIDYFCKVIDGKKENNSSTFYHLQHAAFIEACYKSYKEKKNVSPKEYLNKIKNEVHK